MAKEVKKVLNLIIGGGEANPAPPVGPTLAQAGLNIQEFCAQFNERTKDQRGVKLPVVITVYDDRTFDFIVKKPAVTYLLKRELNLEKGAKESGRQIVGKVSQEALRKIAEEKMSDLNVDNVEAAMRVVKGTARSMGIVVEE